MLVDSIGLNGAIDSIGDIAGIAPLSLDTIVLSSLYSNKITLIGGSGEVLRVIDLSPHLIRADSACYELWASGTTPFIAGGACFFNVSLVANSIRAPEPDQPQGEWHETRRYFHLENLSPRIAVVAGLNDKPTITLALDSFYWKMHPGAYAMPETGPFECLNDLVFVRSHYTPNIDVFRASNWTPVASFTVRSEHSSASIAPLSTELPAIMGLQDSLNQRLSVGGYVQTIRYDVPSGNYWVVLVHRVPTTVSAEMRGLARPFSILEYSPAFKLLNEHRFKGRKYLMHSLLSMNSGTYMQRWEDRQAMVSGKHVFERIRLNEGH
jgi:hypothetical protein